MAMRLHSQSMKVAPDRRRQRRRVERMLPLLQIMADAMNSSSSGLRISQKRGAGAALRAAARPWLVQAGERPEWEKVVAGFTDPDSEQRNPSEQKSGEDLRQAD